MTLLYRAEHRTIMVVDVEGFGDHQRTNWHQIRVRKALYLLLELACDNAGICWQGCYHEDRGDGVLILAPADVPKSVFVSAVLNELASRLCAHNDAHPVEEQIRLRVAVHAGEIHFDDHGVVGGSVTLAFRLLDSLPLRIALVESPGSLVFIVSSWIFDEVVRHDPENRPESYYQVRVVAKETDTIGWVCVPDIAEPAASRNYPRKDHLSRNSPRQLPATIAHFVGRFHELQMLSDYLNTSDDRSGAVRIACVDGTAGVGKTTLAIHWAHQVRHRFPDGQLYVNLRGFSPRGEPMTTAQVINSFLDAFQASPVDRPVEIDALAALYRSIVADMRLLIVLDNARDSDQIRRLLPGGSGCFVLVTTRTHMSSLVVKNHARRVALAIMSRDEARTLIALLLGEARIRACDDAVDELIDRCACLPLALSVAAARVLMSPATPVRALTADLRRHRGALDVLSTADSQETSVRAVFSWSYAELSSGAARLFRLLGVHPGPDISLVAIVALAGQPEEEVRAYIAELIRANLLDEHTVNRYQFHDLLRAYAAEQAHMNETDAARWAAIHRFMGYYAHSANAASLVLCPQRDPILLAECDPQVEPETFTDHRQGIAWCESEQAVLFAVVTQAANQGFYEWAWQIPWALAEFYLRRGDGRDWLTLQKLAVSASQQLPDSHALAHSYRELGRVYKRTSCYEDSEKNHRRALELYKELDDTAGQARAYRGLAEVRGTQDQYQGALKYAKLALAKYQEIDHRDGESQAYNYIGWYLALLHNHRSALPYCYKALDMARDIGNRMNEAATLGSIGYSYLHLGRISQAIDCYQQALGIFRDLGHLYHQGDFLTGLGDAQLLDGDAASARKNYETALEILDKLDHRDAETVRLRLIRLGHVPEAH